MSLFHVWEILSVRESSGEVAYISTLISVATVWAVGGDEGDSRLARGKTLIIRKASPLTCALFGNIISFFEMVIIYRVI